MSITKRLDHFRVFTRANPRWGRTVETLILIAVLLAPSVWMLCRIPPLWRDIDAYTQVTHPPGLGTILHYCPLYCFAARIPLYLGFVFECLWTGTPLPTLDFFHHPKLTDSGVLTLLIVQHAALCWSALRLIRLASRFLFVRLILALVWAANPLFYSFAHCVGTETLSMILLLLIGAQSLVMIRRPRGADRKDWILFGLLLTLCILTRHVNAVLAALMPLAFLLLTAWSLAGIRFARTPIAARRHWLRSRQALTNAAVAAGVGALCIALSNTAVRGLCRIARIPYHSTVGSTFLFRLDFLQALPAGERDQLLERVAENSDSTDVKQIVSLLRGSFQNQGSAWDVMAFDKKARALDFAQDRASGESNYYAGLNGTALAFLYPPAPLFLKAVASDFNTSLKVKVPDIVAQLFVSTRYYFLFPEMMPDYASLATFRDSSISQIMAIFKRHDYFHRGRKISLQAFAIFWGANLFLVVVLERARKKRSAIPMFAIALMLTGLLMTLANCFLNVFQPRYTLPTWELGIISASILMARVPEFFVQNHTKRHRGNESKLRSSDPEKCTAQESNLQPSD